MTARKTNALVKLPDDTTVQSVAGLVAQCVAGDIPNLRKVIDEQVDRLSQEVQQ